MHLFLISLLAVSVFCLSYGLWRGYHDVFVVRPDQVETELPDEELMIFDRVTSGLSQIPRLGDPTAFQAAQAEVMQQVGDEYGLSAKDVETIYWRVRRWMHASRRWTTL
jgi:hypothetical protein